jgi:uncharacterized protein YndB with AHSA1/START domain
MESIERIVAASPERVWELWTTADGICAWWAPEGFRTDVETIDLHVDGGLVYTMTAVAPEQVAFMEQHGMPQTTRSQKRFTELDRPSRLAYASLIDFVPDHEPYEHLTIVDLEGHGPGTRVVMQVEPLHDEVWTRRLLDGRTNELANLERLVASAWAGAGTGRPGCRCGI